MAKVLIGASDPTAALEAERFFSGLVDAGYTVEAVTKAELSVQQLQAEEHEVVVLDRLPEFDSCRLVEAARAVGIDVPIVLISAGGTEQDRLRAFELGADDYIVGAFSPREAMTRIRAVIRRGALSEERRAQTRTIRELTIDAREVQAYVHGQVVELTPTEFALLDALATNRGVVVTRDELMEKVWGRRGIRRRDRTVDQFVKRVRQKLDAAGAEHSFIHTCFGLGYRFEPEEKPETTSDRRLRAPKIEPGSGAAGT